MNDRTDPHAVQTTAIGPNLLCPSWCTEPSVHLFEDHGDGVPKRFHTVGAHSLPGIPPGGVADVVETWAQVEEFPAGGRLRGYVVVHMGSRCLELSAADARALAGQLLERAAHVEAVAG